MIELYVLIGAGGVGLGRVVGGKFGGPRVVE